MNYYELLQIIMNYYKQLWAITIGYEFLINKDVSLSLSLSLRMKGQKNEGINKTVSCTTYKITLKIKKCCFRNHFSQFFVNFG
jgi:hypothetical protein